MQIKSVFIATCAAVGMLLTGTMSSQATVVNLPLLGQPQLVNSAEPHIKGKCRIKCKANKGMCVTNSEGEEICHNNNTGGNCNNDDFVKSFCTAANGCKSYKVTNAAGETRTVQCPKDTVPEPEEDDDDDDDLSSILGIPDASLGLSPVSLNRGTAVPLY